MDVLKSTSLVAFATFGLFNSACNRGATDAQRISGGGADEAASPQSLGIAAKGVEPLDALESRPIDAYRIEPAPPVELGTVPNDPPHVEPPAPKPPTLADARITLAAWGAQASSIAVIKAVSFSVEPYPVYGAQTTATIAASELLRGDAAPRTVQYIGGKIGEITYRPAHEYWLDTGRVYLARFDGSSLSGLRLLDAAGNVVEQGYSFDVPAMRAVFHAGN